MNNQIQSSVKRTMQNKIRCIWMYLTYHDPNRQSWWHAYIYPPIGAIRMKQLLVPILTSRLCGTLLMFDYCAKHWN